MTHRIISIATRRSRLALWQTEFVAEKLRKLGFSIELVPVETEGDRNLLPFEQISGQGFFTKAVQDSVLSRQADVAVHSLKDLPTQPHPHLTLAALPHRGEVGDLLLIHPDAYDPSAPIIPLATGHTVGTSSSRRRSQLQTYRPDLRVEPLRGNVPTRVEKLRSGKYGAIVLAAAGVRRLQLDTSPLIEFPLPIEKFVPAPGQGTIAVECRRDDTELIDILKKIHDPSIETAVRLERGLMRELEGGCQLPLGAHAKVEGPSIAFLVWYRDRTFTVRGSEPKKVLEEAMERIKSDG